LDLLPSSGEGTETPAQFCSLERANHNHLITDVALSKDIKKTGFFFLSPEDGNKSSFRNVAFSIYLEFWTTDKVYKPSD
jgi:hypothetical protein